MDRNDLISHSDNKLEEQLEQEKIFQDVFHNLMLKVYSQKITQEELASEILNPILDYTGIPKGALFFHQHDNIRIVSHRCENPCENCTLLDLLKGLDNPQTISISLQEGQNTNSFFVNDQNILNELYNEPSADQKGHCLKVIRSCLMARSYLDQDSYADLVLVNAPEGFNDSHLTWMERFIGLFTLVYQQDEMKKALQSAQSDVVEAGKAKAQFLANVSHEIRSPLNGVICMASLLNETELDEEQQDLLNIIQFSAENITRIIQDLLDLTQLSTGKMEIRMESFSLQELLNNLFQNFRKDFLDRGLDFQFSIEEGLDLFMGDKVRISQIISNLLNNALKYTEKGSVFLDLRREQEQLALIISDTGVGIPEDKLNRVFDQFVQLHSSDKKGKTSGVGLGLAIVKELVELMGGRIEVRSRVNRGSAFSVWIPMGGTEASQSFSGASDQIPRDNSSTRILVAEDDFVNSLYLKTFLGRKGFQIDQAENGSMAVNLCRVNSYHLVLMDVSMPVMDGLEATRNIRMFAPSMNIIAVTAHAYEEDLRRIRDAGMDAIVLKPIDEKDLMNAINRALKR